MVSLRRIALLSICVFALKAYAAPADEKLEWKAYSMHQSTFTQSVTGTAEDFGHLAGVKPVGKSDGFDVGEFFASQGVPQPPGSKAIYFPSSNGLLVLNSPENFELLDELWTECQHDPGSPARVELTLALFESGKDVSTLGQLNYRDLRKIAGDSWTEIATMGGICSSGRKVEFRRILEDAATPNPAPNSPQGQIPERSFGEIAAVEIIVGPDGDMIDADVSFRARESAGGSEVLNLSYNGQSTVASGKPTVLQVFTGGAGDLGCALVLRVTRPHFAIRGPLSYDSLDLDWKSFPTKADGKADCATRIPDTDGYDVRKLLEVLGMTIRDGEEAVFFPSVNRLIVNMGAWNGDMVKSVVKNRVYTPNSAEEAKLPSKVYPISTYAFFNDENSREGMEAINGSQELDVSTLLESMGMTFPAGSAAVYFPSMKVLWLRNTTENQDLMAPMSAKEGVYPNSAPSPPSQ